MLKHILLLAAGFCALMTCSSPALADSSATHRQNQNVYATLSLGFGPGIGGGFQLGYFIQPDLVAAASVHNYSDILYSTTSMQALHVKGFLGNSFYVFGGPALRTIKFHDIFESALLTTLARISDDPNIESVSTHYETQDVGLELAIGNQWQGPRLTLGCDWIGWYQPLHDLKNGGERRFVYKDGRREIIPIKLKGEYTDGHFRLLNFYLGLSF